MPDFPDVANDDYLTRRAQIGGKKRKKDEGKAKRGGKCDEDEEEAEEKPKSRGRGRGQGQARGRGRGRSIMKKPAAKAAPPPPQPTDEEGGEEEDEEEDIEVEEGKASATSNGAMEVNDTGSKRLRRAKPIDQAESDQPSASSVPKTKAKSKAKAKACPQSTRASSREELHDPLEIQLFDEIQECLNECTVAGEIDTTAKHAHRELEQPDEFVSFSMYWGRKAVGVKLRAAISEKWVQVAYFARETPCIFTNHLLALRWVILLARG